MSQSTAQRVGDEEEQRRETDALLPNNNTNSSRKEPQTSSSRWKRWLYRDGKLRITATSIAGIALTLVFAGMAIWFIVMHGNVPWHHDRRPSTHDHLSDHLVQVTHGAVASDVDVCSQIGVDIMRNKGGSAVDAAIASTLCIGVINNFASGIGGGGFMVVRHPNGSSKSINFREIAPGASHRDMFKGEPTAAQYGPLSIGVPGEIAGFHTAWKMYGLVKWEDLFEPTIRLCQEGYAATTRLVAVINGPGKPFLEQEGPNSEWGWLFKPDTNQLVEIGDVIRRPNLAKTLMKIQKHGWKEFYTGGVAKSLVKYVRKAGGILTMEDMKNYHVTVDDTIKTHFLGHEVLTCPPPCSGPALLEGLNIASGLDMSDGQSPLTMHYAIETMKWLSAGRTELGDPFDPAVRNNSRIKEIMTKKWAEDVRRNISDDRTYGWDHYRPAYEFVDGPGTSQLSILDEQGMAVSITSTVNLIFGARMLDPATGIVLNGEMDDFSIPDTPNAFHLRPSVYNYIKPGKRPLSSCAPTITVKNGLPSLVVGGSGGSHIVTSVFLTILRVHQWGYSVLDAIYKPRVHHQLLPDAVFVESGGDENVLQGLRARGHVIMYEKYGSVVQGIHRKEDGVIDAVSDYWRKGGKPAGLSE